MKIVIGSDKSGFPLKEAVKSYLVEQGHQVEDIGTQDMDKPNPFFAVAPLAAKKIQQGEAERGILCCGTGMGMSVVANKFQGITAAVVESVYAAKMCRAINDANILCMGGWLVADWLGIQMTKAFMETAFTQDLESWRQEWLCSAKEQVALLEKDCFKS